MVPVEDARVDVPARDDHGQHAEDVSRIAAREQGEADHGREHHGVAGEQSAPRVHERVHEARVMEVHEPGAVQRLVGDE